MSKKQQFPAPPNYLKPTGPGRAFWGKVFEVFELTDAHHLAILANCCRSLDVAETARERITKDGITVTNSRGELREHPACGTERQAMTIFRQNVRELGLDLSDGPIPEVRSPRRGGKR